LRRAASLCGGDEWVKRGSSHGISYFVFSTAIHPT
jgi:hypothetical protein